ncbi:hypothetical protein HYC85_010198 [Camellia sinensis]|uniref:Uncharacterized protein n=1 Tax=Camellia sinensis TaxID=4442 RepID=A0A7J7HJU8_CAMSI|nr:hypothetical protein HYC85_010198 [Camellia sinensis]
MTEVPFGLSSDLPLIMFLPMTKAKVWSCWGERWKGWTKKRHRFRSEINKKKNLCLAHQRVNVAKGLFGDKGKQTALARGKLGDRGKGSREGSLRIRK